MLMFKKSVKDIRHLIEPPYTCQQTNLQQRKAIFKSKIYTKTHQKKTFASLFCFCNPMYKTEAMGARQTNTETFNVVFIYFSNMFHYKKERQCQNVGKNLNLELTSLQRRFTVLTII